MILKKTRNVINFSCSKRFQCYTRHIRMNENGRVYIRLRRTMTCSHRTLFRVPLLHFFIEFRCKYALDVCVCMFMWLQNRLKLHLLQAVYNLNYWIVFVNEWFIWVGYVRFMIRTDHSHWIVWRGFSLCKICLLNILNQGTGS